MTGKKRLDQAGVIYQSQAIFNQPESSDAFVRILDEGIRKYSLELFSFMLMTNH